MNLPLNARSSWGAGGAGEPTGGTFLNGRTRISIADIAAYVEIAQLELFGEEMVRLSDGVKAWLGAVRKVLDGDADGVLKKVEGMKGVPEVFAAVRAKL